MTLLNAPLPVNTPRAVERAMARVFKPRVVLPTVLGLGALGTGALVQGRKDDLRYLNMPDVQSSGSYGDL